MVLIFWQCHTCSTLYTHIGFCYAPRLVLRPEEHAVKLVVRRIPLLYPDAMHVFCPTFVQEKQKPL